MQLEAKKYLFDIKQAADLLLRFSRGKTLAEFTTDPLLRSPLNASLKSSAKHSANCPRLIPTLPPRSASIAASSHIRNILIHGYAEIDHRLVWGILEGKLPDLHRQVESLLAKDPAT